MLSHLYEKPRLPERLVVLGSGGFIAGAIARKLAAAGIPLLGLGRPGFDLLAAGAEDRLAELLAPGDVLLFASAKAPCKNLEMFAENLRFASAVVAALKRRPVAHVVYLGSDAVYRDSKQPITEATCAEPPSLHGAMHLAREVALRQDYGGPFLSIRPTLAYGLTDPHNGYGPNRFRRQAAAGQDIALFGGGEELRDHVHVEDIAELAKLAILHRTTGVANAVSGEVVSFRELAEVTAAQFEPLVAVTTSPRSGPMPHDGYRAFDNRAVLSAFPGFSFTPWREGIARVNAEMKAGGAR